MGKVGCKVTVVSSGQLRDMKLNGIAGRNGVIIEDLTGRERKNKGYMVWFSTAYLNEYLWFIPAESIKIV